MTFVTEQKSCFVVSPLGNETTKQAPKMWDKTGNKDETSTLKALANKVLSRNKARNKDETKAEKGRNKTPQKQPSCFTSKTHLHDKKIFPDEENCPLYALLNRHVFVDIETVPEKGMVLIPDYVTPDDLATAMKLFAFSHFEEIVIALGGDVTKIRRNVIVTPLNLYVLEV